MFVGAVALVLSGARESRASAQTRAATAAWDRPLAEARTAASRGRHADAAALFARADALLGGYPYEERPEYDDDGIWVHDATRGPIRQSFQCPWALEVLASPAPPATDEAATAAYGDAIARVRMSCTPADQARAAHLMGDDLQAALRLMELPAPTPSIAGLPAEATRWATEVRAGRFPIARDVDEAVRFVRAHTAAPHALDATCGAPFARERRVPSAHDPDLTEADEAMYVDEEAGGPAPPTPFETGTPDAIAFVRCAYSDIVSPYDQPSMGPGAETVEYMLLRSTAGVTIVGWFRGMPQYDCWTGVIQMELGHEVVTLDASHRLYTVTRVEGYEDMSSGGAYLVRELVVCDPVERACRTLPVHASETTVTYPDDPDDDDAEPIQHRVAWESTVSFTGGRVRMPQTRRAPASLVRFGARGVALTDFLREAPIDASHLFTTPGAAETSTAPPTPTAVTSACPWRIADTDGSTNVRADASSRATVVTSLANGTVVTVAERRGRWWRVTAPAGQTWGAGWLWAPNVAQRCP